MGALAPAIRYFLGNLSPEGVESRPTPPEWIDPSAPGYTPSIYSGRRGDLGDLSEGATITEAAVDPRSHIASAAIKLKNGRIFTGRTHYEAFDKIPMRLRDMIDDADGFLDDLGRFLTRDEASARAITWSGKPALAPGQSVGDASELVGQNLLPRLPPLRNTKEAIEFGKSATPEQLQALKTAYAESRASQRAFKRLKNPQAYQDEAVRGQYIREAIDSAEGRLSLRTDAPLSPAASPKQVVKPLGELYPKIYRTYSRLSKDAGYSNIPIADLRDALGVSQTAFEQMIRRGPLKGKAVLSKGDWSLSPEHIRSGAMRIGLSESDTPYLLIKLLKE